MIYIYIYIYIYIRKSFNIFLSFNTLPEKMDLDNKIGNLFVADIDFNPEKVNDEILMCNEIYLPIFQ